MVEQVTSNIGPEIEQSCADGFLPEELYTFVSENTEDIKMVPEKTRNNRLPRSIRVHISRMKSEARKLSDSKLEKEAQRLAEAEKLKRFGYTERQRAAKIALNQEIEHLTTLGENEREDQVLTGMKISWYAYAAGLLDKEKRNNFINGIDELNPMQMKAIDDNESWVKIFKQEITPVLPLTN